MSSGLAVVLGLLARLAVGVSVVWAMLARGLAGITTELGSWASDLAPASRRPTMALLVRQMTVPTKY